MLAGLMPSVRRALMGVNGPAKKQLAMAKLMSGATIMYGMFQYAYGASDGSGDYIITGRAPGNKAERAFTVCESITSKDTMTEAKELAADLAGIEL